jgi:hypothetical protein
MADTIGSFFMGGFECSSQRRHDGKRLDLTRSTGHEAWCARDYGALAQLGIKGARDGFRWYLIESRPGAYDWSSAVPLLRAARASGVQVAWDLCHYGWPDHVDIWQPEFVESFARFAAAAARVVRDETDAVPVFCPVNEISFWAWAGGDVARMNPNARGRGGELKRQLVRAAIAAIDAVRREVPQARFLFAEPAIHVDGGLGSPEELREAEAYRLSQFEALDMIAGRLAPELGGAPDYLDIVGVNYYPDNQWYFRGSTIPMGHHAYRPFSEILREIHLRYSRPIVVAETGAEGSGRAAWLNYVTGEVMAAISKGVPVNGICLYPILDTPGWDNERLCPVGLFSPSDDLGGRRVFEPLLAELAGARSRLARADSTALSMSIVPGIAQLEQSASHAGA